MPEQFACASTWHSDASDAHRKCNADATPCTTNRHRQYQYRQTVVNVPPPGMGAVLCEMAPMWWQEASHRLGMSA